MTALGFSQRLYILPFHQHRGSSETKMLGWNNLHRTVRRIKVLGKSAETVINPATSGTSVFAANKSVAAAMESLRNAVTQVAQ